MRTRGVYVNVPIMKTVDEVQAGIYELQSTPKIADIAAVTIRFIYPHFILIIRYFLHELAYFMKWFRPWHQKGKFHCIICASVN
jgi:hypothetical protein